MPRAISVGYSLDQDGRGYRVEVDGDDGQPVVVYHAGNHRGISDAWLPAGHHDALGPATLLQLARSTAIEMAVERGLTEADVYQEEP